MQRWAPRGRPAAQRSPPPSAETILELLSRAGIILFRFDPARGLTFLSGGPRDLLGYSEEELLGDPAIALRVVDPEFMERLSRFGTELFESGPEALRIEVPLVGRSGERVSVEVRVVPETTPDGRVEAFLGVAVDAAELHRLRKARGGDP